MSKTINGRLKNLDKYIQSKWEEHYWNFLMKFEDKLSYSWNGISQNPNITMEMIENSPDKKWDWYEVSSNPNLTMEMIENNLDKNWNWYWISRNPNITMEFIENNPTKPWDWAGISCNPNITMEMIEKRPDKPWNLNYISYNKFTKEKELFYQKYYRIYMATFRLQQYFNRMYDNPKYLFCRNRLDKLFSEMS